MKFSLLHNSNDYIAAYAAVLSFDESEIYKDILSDNELAALNSFKNESRKQQYVTSRILVKELLQDPAVELLNDSDGIPFLNGSLKSISLSHTNELAAIVIGNSKQGIDIEKITGKALRISKRFLCDYELSLINASSNKAELATLFWCIKEAAFKYADIAGATFKTDFIITHCDSDTDTGSAVVNINTGSVKKISLKYIKIQSHYAAFIINDF